MDALNFHLRMVFRAVADLNGLIPDRYSEQHTYTPWLSAPGTERMNQLRLRASRSEKRTAGLQVVYTLTG